MLSRALRGAHLLALLTGPGATSGSSVGLTVGYMGLDEGDVLRGDGAVSRWPCTRQTRSVESASGAPHRIHSGLCSTQSCCIRRRLWVSQRNTRRWTSSRLIRCWLRVSAACRVCVSGSITQKLATAPHDVGDVVAGKRAPGRQCCRRSGRRAAPPAAPAPPSAAATGAAQSAAGRLSESPVHPTPQVQTKSDVRRLTIRYCAAVYK